MTELRDDKILRVKLAADYLDLSPSTLNKLRCKGGGPPYVQLTARAIGYRQSDLAQYAASRLRRSTSAGIDYRPNADRPTNRGEGATRVADAIGVDGHRQRPLRDQLRFVTSSRW